MRITRLRRQDLTRCVELEKQLFSGDDPWSERIFLSELRHASNHYFGAYTDDDTLVGYAGLAVNGRAPDFETEVHTIGVDLAWQGKGIGKGLLRAMLRIADRHNAPVFLEVRTDNAAAIALYRAHGFEQLGLRKNYYQPSGADAYTMVRPAQGAPDSDGMNP
ncbi:MAG TPA: ribosomal protein S18-alanine N-acetyltransferase [Pseudonocardiaceae bacterium]|nr:ribosomal protein S18-alanine N-acetyltransferase [Pseudonocardiaceae bacterium]